MSQSNRQTSKTSARRKAIKALVGVERFSCNARHEIVGKALDLGCDVLDDPLRILEVAAGCREERRREPAHLVADIEDLVLLGLCHGHVPL